MALQSSGAISILDITVEFGGTSPHSLNEYYGVASGVPGSGAISLSSFYGAASVTANQAIFYAGSHWWTCPAGVNRICVVAVGGGGGGGEGSSRCGGSGGGLAWGNDFPTYP